MYTILRRVSCLKEMPLYAIILSPSVVLDLTFSSRIWVFPLFGQSEKKMHSLEKCCNISGNSRSRKRQKRQTSKRCTGKHRTYRTFSLSNSNSLLSLLHIPSPHSISPLPTSCFLLLISTQLHYSFLSFSTTFSCLLAYRQNTAKKSF